MRRLLPAVLLTACGGGGAATPDALGNRDDGGAIDARPLDAAPPVDAAAPDAFAGALADIQPWPALMDGTAFTQFHAFAADDAAVVEGCTQPGARRLLRFDTVTANLGEADFYVGAPSESNPLFEWSPAHGHFHVKGYANYRLIAGDGSEVTGHKQAFCLLDSTRISPDAVAHYNCSDQGISVGYADTYGSYLDCQWIDITGLPAGTYTLRVEINPDHVLPESDYTNNVYETAVDL